MTPSSPPPSASSLRESLRALPPSAKLVVKTLEYEGRLTQSQLADESRLPQRTVRHALGELEERDVVVSSIYFADARKRVYELAAPLVDDAGRPAASVNASD